MKPVVMILGRGLIGTALAQRMPDWWEVLQISRRDGFDISDPSRMKSLLASVPPPQLIINAAGIIDPRAHPTDILRSNATAPWVLADISPCPVIHISTDCVFQPVSGKRRTPFMPPDVIGDIYGISKAAGEAPLLQLVVRTSFVGEGSRMWEALRRAAESDHIYFGWSTLWSGGHVDDVADVIISKVMPEALGGRFGIIHVARREPISKFRVASLTAEHLDLKIDIHHIRGPEDRILVPTEGFELGPYLGEEA